jgi:hypothetical protein
MKAFVKILLAIVTFCSLCSCESVNASFWAFDKSTNGIFGEPKNPSDVDLFITKKPTYNYKEVGIITYETFAAYNDEASVYQIMRERAAKAGVDAIIILNAQEFSSPPTFLSPYPRGRGGRSAYYYDRRAIPDMYRYRAMAIIKTK